MTRSPYKLDLNFASLELFNSIIISTIKEDILVEKDNVEELRKICREQFGDREFVYISDRRHNYNVNPVVYIDLIKNEKLRGIAIVSQNIDKLQTAVFEKNFSPVPFEIFQNKDEALVWARGLMS
jgi:hypothetical protein